jgi:hypothetical protein
MQRLDHGITYQFTGWVRIDRERFMLVPPSTAYDGPKIKYWHPEACAGGCVCEPDPGVPASPRGGSGERR